MQNIAPRHIFYTRIFFLIVFIVAVQRASASENTHVVPRTDVFDVTFRAVLLEPGIQSVEDRAGSEIRLAPIEWTSSTTGRTTAALWGAHAEVHFDSADRHQADHVLILSGAGDPPEKIWDIWRHRHGFVLTSANNYKWLSLSGVRPDMDVLDGRLFDGVLHQTWGYWVSKALNEKLNTASSYQMQTQEERNAFFKKSIELTYDATGLTKPTSINFQINLWQMPVKVQFDVHASTTQTGSLVEVDGVYHWTYSSIEWRRLHGYEKSFWGGYEWLPGFPSTEKLTDQQGFLLDQLLDKTIAYWVDVSIEMVRSDLDLQLKKKIQRL